MLLFMITLLVFMFATGATTLADHVVTAVSSWHITAVDE
jgi:hypothetical protein